jgi:hypothetical protein
MVFYYVAHFFVLFLGFMCTCSPNESENRCLEQGEIANIILTFSLCTKPSSDVMKSINFVAVTQQEFVKVCVMFEMQDIYEVFEV